MFNKTSNGMNSNFWKELVKLIFLSILIVVPFRIYIAQPFIVDGASMDPTFETGDYLIVDEFTYHFKTPERGSVLIFKYPKDPSKSFIKRVIGLPGEKISISDGQVTIINIKNPDGFLLDEPYVKLSKSDSSDLILHTGEYFVLGDNRLASLDSRVWGPVPEENIIGRPLIRFFPPTFFPGDNSKSTDQIE
ncbi:MAG: signal peptidase I [bacterium]|nr:signal peptidase I [bacterium]